MKTAVVLAVALIAGTSLAKGLYCGKGAMSPMEARLERTCGNTNAVSTRIATTQRKSRDAHAALAAETERQAQAMKEQIKNSSCSGSKKSCCGGTVTCDEIRAHGGIKAAIDAKQREMRKGGKSSGTKSSKSGGKKTK